jgi:hypothetical protein
MMKEVSTSKTSVYFNKNSQHCIPKGCHIHIHCHDSLKSYKVLSFFFLLSYSVSSQCAGSEMKPLTYDRGGDSVLLGRSYSTPHGAVIDEYGAMVEGENRRTRRKTFPSATLSTANPTWIDPGSNPGLRGERPATKRLSHGTAQCARYLDQNYTIWSFVTFSLICYVYGDR